MLEGETIKIRKLHVDAKVPERHSDGAAGYDLCALEEGVLKPNQITKVRTGLSFEISDDLIGMVFGRSGMGLKFGLTVVDTRIYPGCKDELVISMFNTSDSPYVFSKGDRMCQIVFIQTSVPPIELVNEMDTTIRGESGFGSTGIN